MSSLILYEVAGEESEVPNACEFPNAEDICTPRSITSFLPLDLDEYKILIWVAGGWQKLALQPQDIQLSRPPMLRLVPLGHRFSALNVTQRRQQGLWCPSPAAHVEGEKRHIKSC